MPKPIHPMVRRAFLTLFFVTALPAAPDLLKITSQTPLDAAIPAAAEQPPQVETVLRTFESAPGVFRKIHTTIEALMKEKGSDNGLAISDTHRSIQGILKAHRAGGKTDMLGDRNKMLAL